MIVEVIGGTLSNSLAILTDAAHLLSDIAGFAIAIFAIWASGWEATPHQSFGFYRLEILGALVSIQIIWLITGVLLYEAIVRFLHPKETINGRIMFIVALVGLLSNVGLMFTLGHDGHGHTHAQDHNHDNHDVDLCTSKNTNGDQNSKININVRGAYLHALGDLIQSIGVMISGCVIWYNPNLKILDPICTILFSILVLATTIQILRDVIEVLMESTPREIDATTLQNGLLGISGVVAVHELHIWAITMGKTLLACHILAEPLANTNEVLHKVTDYCEKTYGISHVTIQVERDI
ncbi:unnamed protein product [Sphagnum troendelagicum]|uniref:Uncharacterized protein n=1 Tax=Sphagnum troendelagicum TaxID=128251 RepID=A0ABP0U977_9BRYO